MRLLVAEDEKALLDVTVKRLKAEGYAVDACLDGEEALDYLQSVTYDLLILDIMMPKRDGLSVLKWLRMRQDKTPVLLLTARDSIEDRVNGLDAGADDYLTKPFSFEELMARIRVLLRRINDEVTNVLQVGDLILNLKTHEVRRAEKSIDLSAREFAMLEYMMRNRGTVLSRAQLENHVWDYGFEGGSNIVDVYIRYLRRKIDQDAEHKLIHTVRGTGYVIKEEA